MSPETLQSQYTRRPEVTNLTEEGRIEQMAGFIYKSAIFARILGAVHRSMARFSPTDGICLDLGAGPGSLQLLGLDPKLRSRYIEIDNDPEKAGAVLKFSTGSSRPGQPRTWIQLDTGRKAGEPILIDDATQLHLIRDSSVDYLSAMNLVTILSARDASLLIGTIARVLKPGGLATLPYSIAPSSEVSKNYASMLMPGTQAISVPVRAEVYEGKADLVSINDEPWLKYGPSDALRHVGFGIVQMTNIEFLEFNNWFLRNFSLFNQMEKFRALPNGLNAVLTLINNVTQAAIYNSHELPTDIFSYIQDSAYSLRLEIMLANLLREWQIATRRQLSYTGDIVDFVSKCLQEEGNSHGLFSKRTDFGYSETAGDVITRFRHIRLNRMINTGPVDSDDIAVHDYRKEMNRAVELTRQGVPVVCATDTYHPGLLIDPTENAILTVTSYGDQDLPVARLPFRSNMKVLFLMKPAYLGDQGQVLEELTANIQGLLANPAHTREDLKRKKNKPRRR